MINVERKIFECSLSQNKGTLCPVACKFKAKIKERPIPEAYLGNPKSKFMIIGINPGANHIKCNNFEEYQSWIRNHTVSFWQYHYAAEIFGYSLRNNEGMVTNLIHCPTPGWSVQKDETWRLSDIEKQKSLELCSPFCFEMIDKVDPELILLHGLDVAKFFSDHCGWGIPRDAENKDIHGLKKRCNSRTFVLSRHVRSMCFKKGQGAWKPLEEVARNIERNR
jgi:hypothetical protein